MKFKCLNNLVPKYLSDYFTNCLDPNLALQNEPLNIRAERFLASYPVAFKRPSHFLLSKFKLTPTIF